MPRFSFSGLFPFFVCSETAGAFSFIRLFAAKTEWGGSLEALINSPLSTGNKHGQAEIPVG